MTSRDNASSIRQLNGAAIHDLYGGRHVLAVRLKCSAEELLAVLNNKHPLIVPHEANDTAMPTREQKIAHTKWLCLQIGSLVDDRLVTSALIDLAIAEGLAIGCGDVSLETISALNEFFPRV